MASDSPILHLPGTFETARLFLRKPTTEDASSIFERYASDPDVTKYLPWRPHRDVDETRTFLSRLLRAMEDGWTGAWTIESKDDRRILGLASFTIESARYGDFLSTVEERQNYKLIIGFHLARSEWGQGYATEAAGELVGWGLRQCQVFRIWTVCDVDNVASARVLEKLGMTREGILRRWSIHPNISPEPRDFYCYALVK